jgi:DNA-binding CsgD family transcriptional regulator
MDDETPSWERLAQEIMQHWSAAHAATPLDDALPAFLENPLLADHIGQSTNLVVQVLDMRRFQSVYVSPNIVDVCGFTAEEINRRGVWQWLQNLSWRELLFQARNARLLGQVQRSLPPRTRFHSALVNSGMRDKTGRRKRILSQNFTLSWDERGGQAYQLFLWRDATHLLKGDEVVVRHQWTPPHGPKVVWIYDPARGEFLNRELFSAREREVLELVRHGLGSKEIAEKLSISPLTVENHRKNAIRRLQVKNTEGLIEICTWLKVM